MSESSIFWKHATSRVCIYRSIKVALFIGTILGVINHYDAILSGHLTSTNLFQMAITYMVPFSVATYGAAMQAKHIELQSKKRLTSYDRAQK
jgi:hypothetical protein